MKILVVGSGGREHAIICKLLENESISEIFCAPGNGGISEIATIVDIKATDINKLAEFAMKNEIDFTIVGMDDPLVLGIVDVFEEKGLKIFGPNKEAAQLEGSKAFSKMLMKKYNIPTALYTIIEDYNIGEEYILNYNEDNFPIVIKADGLAVGKGVYICENKEDAINSLKELMVNKKFGNSGNKVIIEEYLIGPEVSVLAFCDGKTIVPMVSATDHKRIFDNDLGENTGGMGAISPSRVYNQEIEKICMDTIFIPTINGLINEKIKFVGIIFFGLMLTKNGPKVIEYNARFGDPETQVVLPRLKSDLLNIFEKCVKGNLSSADIYWDDLSCACVIMSSKGYPGQYETGFEIKGLDRITEKDGFVYHAGTKKVNNVFSTYGGRVLGVCAKGTDIDNAIKNAYTNISKIEFEGMYFRKDIGRKRNNL